MTNTADAVAAFLANGGAVKRAAVGARTLTEKQIYLAQRDSTNVVVTDAEPLTWFADMHKLFGLANTATRFHGSDENMFKASLCREGDRVAKMLCDALNDARKDWIDIKKSDDMARALVALERIFLSLCYGRFLTAENIAAYTELLAYFNMRPY